jgi:hypothetical protein
MWLQFHHHDRRKMRMSRIRCSLMYPIFQDLLWKTPQKPGSTMPICQQELYLLQRAMLTTIMHR